MNYYQLYPSDEPVIQTLSIVIKFYGWSQISIITEVENKFLEVTNIFQCIVSILSCTRSNCVYLVYIYRHNIQCHKEYIKIFNVCICSNINYLTNNLWNVSY